MNKIIVDEIDKILYEYDMTEESSKTHMRNWMNDAAKLFCVIRETLETEGK